MAKILRTEQAETDLEEIWWYIAQDSPYNADRFLESIEQKSILLSEFNGMGENRDELIKGLKSFPVGSYLIFFFPLEDGIDIVRVLHGSRDIDTIFH